MAKLAMIAIVAAGIVALAALFSFKWVVPAGIFRIAVLLLALTSGGLMAQTAHLGGQIRHSEILNGAVSNGNATGDKNEVNSSLQNEKDDD